LTALGAGLRGGGHGNLGWQGHGPRRPPPPLSTAALAIDAGDVRAAAGRLAGVAHRTPVVTSRTLDERTGARLFLKAENLQRAGAFKFRGAYNRVATLTAAERRAGVTAGSSGNHAHALALAARLCGTRATILMPADAPASKRAATEGYGAEVVTYDRYAQDRDALARALADERGMVLVPPYDDPWVIAGQGTAALELCEDVEDLDVLVVCTGGGGLTAGCAVAARSLRPSIRVVGVEPEVADDTRRSLAAGRRVRIEVGRTIADGQQVPTPGELTFPILQALVEEVVTVTDAEIAAAMRVLFERCKLVVEPSGASALAAVLAGRLDVAGRRVGVTLSGGNVDPERFAAIVGT
jgi:threo-3-hydroxy-L-aspartate ammonia-lyase